MTSNFAFDEKKLPALILRTGQILLVAFFGMFFWFNGISISSITSIDFVLGVLTTGPFIAVIIYSAHRLERNDIPTDRYSRIGMWFVGGLVGFLLLNAAMIAVWPAEGLYNNLAWGLFAASVGGAAGVGIGIFEGRAISRAVFAERHRVQREELKMRNQQLEQFANIVSHDLRNPLSIASGRLELVQMEQENEHLEPISSALDRMDTIIEQTLTLAKSGQTLGDTEPVDIESIAKECWENVLTDEANLEIEETATILADNDRLRHLFENLFRNAIEHTSAGVEIRVGSLDDGFYIEDDGEGIAEAEREDVFDAGYSESEGGTGLGLSIVKQVVDAHQWQIALREGSDGGARFEVTGVEFGNQIYPTEAVRDVVVACQVFR